MSQSRGAHIEDDQVQHDEQQVDDDSKYALQLADNCLGVFQLEGQVLALLLTAHIQFHIQNQRV